MLYVTHSQTYALSHIDKQVIDLPTTINHNLHMVPARGPQTGFETSRSKAAWSRVSNLGRLGLGTWD